MSLPPTPASFAPPATAASRREQASAASREQGRAACRVAFGGPLTDPRTLRIALPTLAGPADECLLEAAEPVPAREGFTMFRAAGRPGVSSVERLAGFALAATDVELEAAAADLYHRLFTVTRGLHLSRIWNYVPHINAVTGGLENYQRFCRGRSLAFEQHFGREFQQRLPAASGVGTLHGPLVLAFLADEAAPAHFENPRQVPAFHYPAEYGPRPPSFSRATLAHPPGGDRQLFISGTAAIRGHASVANGDLDGQLDCTVENLRTIGETSGIGADLGAKAGAQRLFKVYLRRAGDLERVQSHLARSLLRATDVVSYLHADLCRADLLVEIEGVVTLA